MSNKLFIIIIIINKLKRLKIQKNTDRHDHVQDAICF